LVDICVVGFSVLFFCWLACFGERARCRACLYTLFCQRSPCPVRHFVLQKGQDWLRCALYSDNRDCRAHVQWSTWNAHVDCLSVWLLVFWFVFGVRSCRRCPACAEM
jgi:hypothetical protein